MNYLRVLTGVVIDPGHGGEDSGAVGNGIVEKDLTLEISKYMYDRFKELGIPVVLTRDSDSTLTSDSRPNVALSKFGNGENVIIISNHINAGGGEGAEIIYALRNDDKFATEILNNISGKGQVIRKVYQRRLPSNTAKDYYYMLRNTPNAETVIVEYGFLDNVEDANRLKANYKDYADAVVDAVLDYKNILNNETDYYVVKKGDSLWSIASKNNITVSEIKKLNNLTNNLLSIGQKIKLPTNNDNIIVDDNIYIVQKGDTLYSISKDLGIDIEELKKINNLTTNNLSIGQSLLVPIVSEDSDVNTYTVKSGDTLYSIAKKYNISVDKLKSINNLNSNTLSIGQTLNVKDTFSDILTQDYDYYTVKSGDTLYSIAFKYSTTVDELKELNDLTSNTLSIGQLIKIPNLTDSVYVVKSGDTLWSIAKDNNISVDKLKEINNLNNNLLTIGQQLLIRT